MGTSKIEYHRENIEHVLDAAQIEKRNGHYDHDFLRLKLDEREDSAEFMAGVADFWLGLDKKEGADRRDSPFPHSPFYPRGTRSLAKKRPIAEWDEAWRRLEAAKIMAAVRTPLGRQWAEELAAVGSPYLMGFIDGRDQVIGHGAWLPHGAGGLISEMDSRDLDVHWLRPAQALRLPWWDRAEAATWVDIVKGCHRMIEADVEAFQLKHSTPEPTNRTGGRNPL